MPDWLQEAVQPTVKVSLWEMVFRLTAGLVLGCVVAGIYRLTSGNKPGQTTGLTATLVMLTVLICMVTLVIGNSVARAFSLVGALAIVRFRTVVEDTRDTAFVIFAVAVGMGVGEETKTGLVVALLGIPFATGAAFLFRPRDHAAHPAPVDFTLTVRLSLGREPEVLLREPFAKRLERSRLIAVATARQGAALDLTYAVRLRRDATAVVLVTELNKVEGVQEVSLRPA